MKVLITAGPTHEPIDPVRFIGNRSSGKMGIAIAEVFARQGAEVILVLGPTHLKADHANITTVNVETAEEMYIACLEQFSTVDVAVLAAAVADYRVSTIADQKIKKKDDELQLTLVKNPDILAALGQQKKGNQCLVGFALETENLLENAKIKLHKKNLDFIVANNPFKTGLGFGADHNEALIIDRDENIIPLGVQTKYKMAEQIVQHALRIIERYQHA